MSRLKHQTQCNTSFIQPANHYFENGDVVYSDGKTAKQVWKESLTESKDPVIPEEPEVIVEEEPKAKSKKKAVKKED